MKKSCCLLFIFFTSAITVSAQGPGTAYLFSYSTAKNNNHNGLHFAWSRDSVHWHSIGNEYSFVKSDYGPWGAEKRMLTPYLVQAANNTWHCIWGLNERETVFAHAASADLINWARQSYPQQKTGGGFLKPLLQYHQKEKNYSISYTDRSNTYYRVTTKDFKTYSAAKEIPAAGYKDQNISLLLAGEMVTGQVHRVAWTVIDKLIKTAELQQYKNGLHSESAKDDGQRFAGLGAINASVTLQPANAKPISNLLMGIFFEDINYAADGGLYAELIQNRGFEYGISDKKGRDTSWNATHSWTLKGEQTRFTIDSTTPLHPNNPHYAVLETAMPGAVLVNTGFGGISIKKGEQYELSLFARQLQGNPGKLTARLVSIHGAVLAESSVDVPSGAWQSLQTFLVSTADAKDASLELQPAQTGKMALDMVSLFPQKTFKNRKNGLRPDLAKAVADLHPRFVRFPGGCVAHGDGLDNIYRWKNTIGPLETRKPQRNIWNYHQSMGLGYFEYFQFCEDIGAEPLPVIAAGVPCQNSSVGGAGQQGGIPKEEMDEYILDILDLIEWANGDANTVWGKQRAAAGHPQPFNLKYIGIGNEDLITDVFEERFTMIYKAIRQKHPEITVIGTVGPFYQGTDYEEGWALADRLKIPVVDEHYYENPGWFVHNQDFYDRYDRNRSKVYLGEYASRGNTLYNALAEAAFMTALERNGDIVSMASYAPLLAKEGFTQWNPDLIYFTNNEVKPTVNYEVQKLFGTHSGAQYLPASVALSNNQEAIKKRVASSFVRDEKTGDLVIKLVNLLPVPVNTAIDLAGIPVAETKARRITIQGNPGDKNIQPAEDEIMAAGTFHSTLPPYSFTTIRVKTVSGK